MGHTVSWTSWTTYAQGPLERAVVEGGAGVGERPPVQGRVLRAGGV